MDDRMNEDKEVEMDGGEGDCNAVSLNDFRGMRKKREGHKYHVGKIE